jgi:hypothetical protein
MEPRRRVVTGLTGAAFLLIAIGVAAVVFDAGFSGNGGATTRGSGTATPGLSTPPASASPTTLPSASIGSGVPGTPQPSESASPDTSAGPSQHPTGFAQQGDGIVYLAADGTVIPVPLVPGLGLQITEGRAIYSVLASNRYGLTAGSYAGEFLPLVTMGQADGSSAETGGLVLGGVIVSKLISDQLAAITVDQDRWIVALPVDIRGAGKSMVDVSFDQFGLAGWSNTPRVLVRFPGTMPVVESVPSNGGFHVLVEGLGVTSWQVIDPARLSLPASGIDPAHAMNQLLVYGSGSPTLNGDQVRRDILFDRRASVGQLMVAATGDVSVSLVVDGSRADLGPDKILTVGGVPVFVAEN